MLSIDSTLIRDSLVLKLKGRIDANSARALESYCQERLNEGTTKLVMDFQTVDFISSAGLRVILLVAKRLEPMEGSVRLACLNSSLRDVFEISGFSKLFVLSATVDEAL